MGKGAFVRIMEENMSFTIPNSFENTKCHILATVGENEKKIMKDSMEEIVSKHPKAEGITISNVGHGFSLADPVLFNQLVENWMIKMPIKR